MKSMKKLTSLRNELSNLRNDDNKLDVGRAHQELDAIQNYIEYLENNISDFDILEIVNKWCIESLSPKFFKDWENIKNQLKKVRKNLQK